MYFIYIKVNQIILGKMFEIFIPARPSQKIVKFTFFADSSPYNTSRMFPRGCFLKSTISLSKGWFDPVHQKSTSIEKFDWPRGRMVFMTFRNWT